MAQLDLDPSVEGLLAPTLDRVREAVAGLGDGRIGVRLGEAQGLFALVGDTVVLSAALGGPDVEHPLDRGSALPVDRWRRAASAVLEGAALRALAAGVGREPGTDWRWVGAAIWDADRRYPDLQVALADLARARHTGSPGREPRAGFAVMKAIETAGGDPLEEVRSWLGGAPITPGAFLGWGRWVFAADGAQALLPVPVSRPPPADIPLTLPAYSWIVLHVPPSPRGGHVGVEGPGAVADPWGVHDQPLETIAAAVDGEVRLLAEVGGPVGSWNLRSAEGFGQVMGARGFTFEFRASGAMQLVLADAFVGPIAALEMAERVGTSGIVRGRWRVVGPHTIGMSDLDTSPLTMHGHDDPFVLPARGLGLGESIRGMSDRPWRWRIDGDDLLMTGVLQGSEVDVRLARA